MILSTSSQLFIQWHSMSSLGLATANVFIPQRCKHYKPELVTRNHIQDLYLPPPYLAGLLIMKFLLPISGPPASSPGQGRTRGTTSEGTDGTPPPGMALAFVRTVSAGQARSALRGPSSCAHKLLSELDPAFRRIQLSPKAICKF